jgi:DNA-binding CsgD family transcriptional regulator
MSTKAVQLDELLEALAAGAVDALEAIGPPAFVVDADRRVRWQNAASLALLGDLRGRLCPAQGEPELSLQRQDGTLARVAVSSVPLRNPAGEPIGSFGLVEVLRELEPSPENLPRLSPRERETLTLLAAGYSTVELAERMGISKETVRNHVKRVLRALDASSRVEAVAKARRAGLV